MDYYTNYRYLLTNSIPNYKVEPYCPFNIGEGYCFPNGATNCSVFYNLTCPQHNNISYTPYGDVPVPQWMLYKINMTTNPTDDNLPLIIYDKNPFIKTYTNNSVYFQTTSTESPPSLGFQTIGLHVIGQQIKGPTEAEGFNVDRAGLNTLICGGHVTPPVQNGPLYHYHKLSTCLSYESDDNSHAPLIGYANDGFGIYGINDYNHATPIVDECNGHFGYVPCTFEDYITSKCSFAQQTKIAYHYHAVNFNYTEDKTTFYAYYIGCQGPSKLKCNQTFINDNLSIWCSPGCGYEICIQPTTSHIALNAYFAKLGKPRFLEQYTHNSY